MKKLLLAILFPASLLAQTPTPTPDPDEQIGQQYGISALEVKMQRITQAFNEVRELQKVDRSGKVGTGSDVIFDITTEQRQSVRHARRAKLQAIKQLCRDLAEPAE